MAPGLWQVQVLTTHDTLDDAQPGPAERPAPQRRSYQVCISPERARSPVAPPANARESELVYASQGLSGHYVDLGPDGQPRQVEFAYYRLHEARFEGSHDAVGAAWITRTQYLAEWAGSACPPGVPLASGSPAQP